MSPRPPDVDALLSELEPAERSRLAKVDALLAAADPPPELPDRLSSAPTIPTRREPVRSRGRVLALAAALAVTVFAAGILTGDRLTGPGTFRTVALAGTPSAPAASATLEVFDLDDAGNWPMELTVRGLATGAENRRYQLWMTRGGEPVALCGSFLVEDAGTTVVPLNAPWRLDEFDGWVVVAEGSRSPLLTG